MALPNKKVFVKGMRDIPHWIHWALEDGKKIPYYPGSVGKASSTDPNTWCEYGDAVRYFNHLTRDALGFVLSKDDPFVCFDLDKVVKKGVVASWAQKLIDKYDSLTYRSMSGTGFHIWLRSAQPLPGRAVTMQHPSDPTTAIEIFGKERGIWMTGDIYLKRPIRMRTKQINRLYNKLAAYKLAAYKAAHPVDVRAQARSSGRGKVSLRKWLEKHGVEYTDGSLPQADDGIKYKVLCPFSHNHSDGGDSNHLGSAVVWVQGRWRFRCHHAHCSEVGIKDFTGNYRR